MTAVIIEGPYKAIWAALEQWPDWATIVKKANRIRLDRNVPDPFKSTWTDSDFPEATLTYGAYSDSLWGPPGRYANTVDYDPKRSNRNVSIAQDYDLVLISKDLSAPLHNRLKAETMAALRNMRGAPRLGLSYVATVGPVRSGADITVSSRIGASEPGTKRLATIITVPVTMIVSSDKLR